VLVLLFVGDYVLRLPLAVRQVALVAILAGLALVLYRRLVMPLRQSLSDAVLATRVEERYPQLENRLVSSLAFLHAENDPENSDSPDLMRAVVEETARLAPSIRFGDVALARVPLRWASGAGALILVAATAAFAQPELAGTFVERDLLLRDISWPRRTTLSVVDMQPGVAREVTLHHDTVLRIRAEGSAPDRVLLRYRERGGDGIEELVELAPSAEDAALYVFNLHVDADYEFAVTGGDDDRAESYLIDALTPPAVVGIEMRCTYPAYLEREDDVLTDGDQRVPEGTKIEIHVTVNMDLAEAQLRVAGADAVDLEPVPGRVGSKGGAGSTGGARSYRTRLEPKADLRYSFLLTGMHGERNEPHTFVVRVSRDRAPDLRIRAPASRAERTPGGVALIAFTARDDHRIVGARFIYRVGEGEEQSVTMGAEGEQPASGSAIRFLRAAGFPKADESDSPGKKGDQILGLIAVDLARLQVDGKMLPNDTMIAYRVEARDSAGKLSHTRDGRLIAVIAESEIESDVELRQRDLRDAVGRAETQAATVRIELSETDSDSGTDTGTAAATDGDFRRQLGRSQAAVGRMVDQLSLLSGHIRGLVNLYVFNRLDDRATADQALPYYERHLLDLEAKSAAPFRGELYRSLWQAKQASSLRAGGAYLQLLEMADLADRLAVDHAPGVYRRLREAASAHSGGGSAGGTKDETPKQARARAHALVGDAVREHDIVEGGLQRLRRLMREWQSYEGVVRGLRRLKDEESRIVDELKDDKKPTPGKKR